MNAKNKGFTTILQRYYFLRFLSGVPDALHDQTKMEVQLYIFSVEKAQCLQTQVNNGQEKNREGPYV